VASEVGHARGGNYRIVVRGEFHSRLGHLFAPMQAERGGGDTVLTGYVIDQAQLHGLIQRIEELGLELVSVEREGNPSHRCHQQTEKETGE
jgi:hypothetical protein